LRNYKNLHGTTISIDILHWHHILQTLRYIIVTSIYNTMTQYHSKQGE